MLQFFRKCGTSHPLHSCEKSYQNWPELIKSRCNLHKHVGARKEKKKINLQGKILSIS